MTPRVYNEETAKQVSRFLLQAKAVKLRPNDPFQWASGWNSPIYCDNRLTLSYPEIRTFIKEQLAAVVQQHFPEAAGIAGVATAGIPQGALVADALEQPFLYVRPKPKEHGMSNQIEGRAVQGQKVVVVEDLVSTGGSSLKAVAALRAADVEVLGMIAIFSYGFSLAAENFEQSKVPLIVLSDYSYLVEEALQAGYITDADTGSLAEWRKAPQDWKQ